MRSIALIAAAATMIAAPAFAQSQNVVVNGSAEKQCGLGNQSGGGTGGHTPTVSIGDITDANGFLNTSASVDIGFGNVWCNGPANLTMTATSLSNSTPVADAGSFVNAVDMIVDGAQTTFSPGSILLYFGGGEARTGAPLSATIPQEFETGTGRFQAARVRLALPVGTSGNDRPIAGTYTGTVTMTVSPTA